MSDQRNTATTKPLGWTARCSLVVLPMKRSIFQTKLLEANRLPAAFRRAGLFLAVLAAAAFLLVPRTMWAAESAASLARDGLRQYAQADYKAAELAFSEALAVDQDNPRQAFNLGCAVAAQGRLDEALPWFERAATAEESRLAARAQFNIAGVLVAEARKRLEPFGDQPETVPADQRPQVVESLRRAIDAYQVSRRLSQPNEEAAENVERLRLWLDQMQNAWKQFDRQQRRQQLDVLAFLRAIEDEQSDLHEQVRASAAERPSPRRRQAAYEAMLQQLETAGELSHLEAKFQELLAEQAAGATASPSDPKPLDPDAAARDSSFDGARPWIAERINACREHMLQAARHLEVDQWQPASKSQTAADDSLNDLYMAVVPFDQLLARAIERQQELLDAAGRVAGQTGQPAPTSKRNVESPAKDLARRQQRVTLWSEALLQKAQAVLRQAPTSEPPGDEPPADETLRDETSGNTPEGVSAKSDDGMRVACERAVRLCPEIERLSESASENLSANRMDAAVPNQERALALLREIAETLPPPPEDQQKQDQQQQDQQQQDQQQQDQQKQDQQQQDQQQQDQQQQDQQKQDQQQQDQQQQDQQKQDQQKQDQQKQDQQQQDQQKQDQQQQDQQKQDQQKQDQQKQDQQKQDQQQQGGSQGDAKQAGQRDAAERQADAVLQRARQRQRQYAELQRQLQRFLREKSRGDRDW